jgi:hypothetical protein
MRNFQTSALLEKILLLDLMNLQFGQPHGREYRQLYRLLTEYEKGNLIILNNQAHQCFNLINGSIIFNVNEIEVNSIQDYHEKFGNVSPELLRIANKFGLTLKEEHAEKFKLALLEIFGKEWVSKHFGKM